MEYAAESRQPEIAEELLAYFLENKLHDCFAASLYQMYDLLHPDVILELAWKHKIMDFAMPYMIQVMRDYHSRVCIIYKRLIIALHTLAALIAVNHILICW